MPNIVATERSVTTSPAAAIDLLHAQIADTDTQWSLGTFGGIAEFSRDRDEKVGLTQSSTGAAAVTARGGIAIDLPGGWPPICVRMHPQIGREPTGGPFPARR